MLRLQSARTLSTFVLWTLRRAFRPRGQPDTLRIGVTRSSGRLVLWIFDICRAARQTRVTGPASAPIGVRMLGHHLHVPVDEGDWAILWEEHPTVPDAAAIRYLGPDFK